MLSIIKTLNNFSKFEIGRRKIIFSDIQNTCKIIIYEIILNIIIKDKFKENYLSINPENVLCDYQLVHYQYMYLYYIY